MNAYPAYLTDAGQIDCGKVMRVAHAKARYEREGYARIGVARPYAELFAAALRSAWDNAKAARRNVLRMAAPPVRLDRAEYLRLELALGPYIESHS